MNMLNGGNMQNFWQRLLFKFNKLNFEIQYRKVWMIISIFLHVSAYVIITINSLNFIDLNTTFSLYYTNAMNGRISYIRIIICSKYEFLCYFPFRIDIETNM